MTAAGLPACGWLRGSVRLSPPSNAQPQLHHLPRHVTQAERGAGFAEHVIATARANARLIAAAPDLLEALEAVLRTSVRCAGVLSEDAPKAFEDFDAAIGKARTAIAKAHS